MVDSESHGIALAKWHHFRSRLHPRSLFRKHELSTGKVAHWFWEKNRYLYRKYVLAIEILVQAVIVSLAILEEQWRGPDLSGVVTALDELLMPIWIANLDTHSKIPAVGDRRQLWIERRPQAPNKAGERIAEVLVLSPAEAVSSHDDAAAEDAVVGIKPGDRLALLERQEIRKHRASLSI
jgi:hypothetical protein